MGSSRARSRTPSGFLHLSPSGRLHASCVDDPKVILERKRAFHRAFKSLLGQSPKNDKEDELLEESLNRMHYRIRIERKPNTGAFSVHALGCESHFGYPRFARKYGADRFLRATIEAHSCGNELAPIYWLGRKWVWMCHKLQSPKKGKSSLEGDAPNNMTHIFFAEDECDESEECLCENLSKPTGHLPGHESLTKVRIEDVLRSHVPYNVCSSCAPTCKQHFLCRQRHLGVRSPERELIKSGKYAKRVGLGWTQAEPTVVFDAADILEWDDLKSLDGRELTTDRNGHLSISRATQDGSEVLTDGNGLLSISSAKQVRDKLGLEYLPAVFQGRLGPCKGTWTVHSGVPDGKIVVSREMSKWFTDWSSCAEDDRTFEVKDFTSATLHPQRLNSQFITVLSARGVPTDVFTKLVENQVQRVVEDALEDTSPQHGLPGYGEAQDGKTRLALQMIDAGISKTEPMCFKWLVEYLAGRVKTMRDKCQYECPDSWNAFLIPDWSRKLLPGECIFQKGEGDFVEGQVMVARNPCTAPWDIQVLKALGHNEIRERFGHISPPYLTKGVIVVSAHDSCERAPASLLAGGDYDGDKAFICAYYDIVTHLGEPGSCALDADLIRNVQKTFGKKVSDHDAKTCDVQKALEQAYHTDVKCRNLVGELANLWAFSSDACTGLPTDRDITLWLGLMYQEALDGKLTGDVDGAPILDFIRSPNWHGGRVKEFLPPHWHNRALKLQQSSGKVQQKEFSSQGKIRKSTSVLGCLFDFVGIDKLKEAWRNSYGGENYAFEKIQKQGCMTPDPLLARSRHLWEEKIPYAGKILHECVAERQRVLDHNKVKSESVSEDSLFAQTRSVLFKDATNSDEVLYRAVAFYHSQLSRFNARVEEGRQSWTAGSVEWHLEPAWRVCARELCGFAASQDGEVCCLNKDRRSRLHYKCGAKRKSYMRKLLEESRRGDDEDDLEHVDDLISKFTRFKLA